MKQSCKISKVKIINNKGHFVYKYLTNLICFTFDMKIDLDDDNKIENSIRPSIIHTQVKSGISEPS